MAFRFPHRLAATAALVCGAVAALAAPAPRDMPAVDAPPVQDPHYGDPLFHFYQEHYFTSLTNLMVSQHFKRVEHHADDAEILRGGLLLSYGLHREAGDIFTRLIEGGAKPPVRDRAWFFLAKIRYQRGYVAEALDAVGRIGNSLPPKLDEERALLHSNLLMAQGDYAGAAALLTTMVGKPGAGPYARYNLGVALVKSGDSARGGTFLDTIGQAPAADEEARSLRDKANVALGFSALQDNRFEDARTYLERVRLAGMQANKALLGFGWAAAALKQPQKALVPWTELAARDPSDAAALEARIALPFAYADMGAYGQALTGYQDAITSFDNETKSLDESIAAIRTGKLVEGLLAKNPGEEMGWFWNIKDLPEMPHGNHLAQVLAQHEFQEAFKNYRDLRFLASNLTEWQEKLGVFGDMLDNRRAAFAARLPVVQQKAGETGLPALQQRRDTLAAELARAETDQDAHAFADAKERDMLTRLAAIDEALKSAGDDPDSAQARERRRLVAGALQWQLTQLYSPRLWEAKKALTATDQGLADAAGRGAALVQAQKDEPVRFEAFAARIAELDRRIRALSPRVTTLGREQQQEVQSLAVAELERQKERLAVYTTQARFALAQIYDRANQTREADGEAKK